MAEELTDDVKTLLGNPKKAILSMTVPIAIANLVISCNNIIDAVWVSGLGTAALASTGVVFPFFFMMLGIGNGIGVGSNQAIARRIGAGKYEDTHKVAAQAVYMILLAGTAVGILFSLTAEPLMSIAGAGDYMDECLQYCMPIFIASPVIMLGFVLAALLRAEGSAKRSMKMNVIGAVLNIILDPIFIYVFGWGLTGAACATAIAMSTSTLLGLYWYFGKKDTFVKIPMRHFRFDWTLDRDILRVGIPATLDMAMMSITSLLMNRIILTVDPVDGIAIYSTGWRALDMLMIPAMALGNALVPVCAAAYGAKRYDKIREGYGYSLKMGTVMMLFVTVFTFFAAPLIVALFTYSQDSSYLADPMVSFLRIGCSFMPLVAIGYSSGALFQALGMGMKSFICTSFKNLVRLPLCGALTVFGTLSYLWWGLSAAEILGSVVAFVWAAATLRALLSGRGPRPFPKTAE